MMNRFSVILLLLCCSILIVVAVLSPFARSWAMATFLAEAYVVAAASSFLAMLLDNRKGGVSYMFEFFMLFFIAIPAMFQINAMIFPWFANLQPQYIGGAYGIIAVSHLSFHGGWLFRTWRNAKTAAKQTPLLRPGDMRFYTKWAWSLAVLATLFAAAAGPSNLLVARFERGDGGFEGLTQQFLFMSRSLSLLAIVMLLFLVREQKESGLRRQNIIAVMLFLPAFLVINYLPALPRFVLFGIFLAISTIFLDFFRPRTKAFVAVASVLTLFIVFPVIKSLGAGELNWGGFAARADLDLVAAYLLRVDFDAFMQIASTVEYVASDVGPIRYGQNFLGVALFFVPRAIWPGKPEHTGGIVANALGYPYINVSSPLPAEALAGFGYLGPLFAFVLLGILVAQIEANASIKRNLIPSPSASFAYAVGMGFLTIVMRGSLNAVAPQFATAFIALMFIVWFKKRNLAIGRKPSNASYYR